MSKKILLTSGCSFTEPDYSWAYQLSSTLNIPIKNYAQASRGNGFISRTIIYGVQELLKTYEPNNLLVGIMWSCSDRNETFFIDVDNSLIDSDSNRNPFKFIEESKPRWVSFNPHWHDKLSRMYFHNFYDFIGSQINTLEHILRTQWFLQKYNIDYFMATISNNTLPQGITVEFEEVKYLYDMIDFSKFLDKRDCLDWCKNHSVIPFIVQDDMHPSSDHHKQYTKEVVLPFINKNIYPCKEGEVR